MKTQGEVRERIDNEVRKEFHKSQREAILREQLKAIQKELATTSGGGGPENDAEKLKESINQQLLEASEAKILIFRIGYFRDPIGQHQKHISCNVSDALARIATARKQPEGELLQRGHRWLAELP